eukprot:gb/GEZN01022098.1/.p1 GENE.gb/GEZN01022098.1/~~gb/GEZN01022098.1/.p1  ORF type:complete len:110 (-),score=15.06 gb/GEZN01022098.1/:182-511(-)
MHGAGFQGRHEIVPILAKYGLDPNDYHSDGYTPLMRAAWGNEKRHVLTVQALYDAGADPRLKDKTSNKRAADLTENKETKKLLKRLAKDLKSKERKSKRKSEPKVKEEL